LSSNIGSTYLEVLTGATMGNVQIHCEGQRDKTVETVTIVEYGFLATRQADLRGLVFRFHLRWKVSINLERYESEGSIMETRH